MKNLEYYLHSNIANDNDHLDLVSKTETNGGRIPRNDIDVIKSYPHVTAISISGLTQDTFDYFVDEYGHQFSAINFWKCPAVSNLQKLEQLTQIQYITYYWNNRAEKLWDVAKNKCLKGISVRDFKKLNDLSEISMAECLEELDFGMVHGPACKLNTLEPIANLKNLKRLNIHGARIIDGRIEPLSKLQSLEVLNFVDRSFTTEQIAWLKAKLPESVQSREFTGCIVQQMTIDGELVQSCFPVGKGKRWFIANDTAKIEQYNETFEKLYDWFKAHPNANPEDYIE